MKVEDIKEPCYECIHEARCLIRHPELMAEIPEEERVTSCEKYNKFSRHIEVTRGMF